jgi:hypothetical protein
MRFSLQHAFLVLVVLLTTACIQVETGTKAPTIGDQIVDLVKARKLGIISEDEFKQLRRKALASF